MDCEVDRGPPGVQNVGWISNKVTRVCRTLLQRSPKKPCVSHILAHPWAPHPQDPWSDHLWLWVIHGYSVADHAVGLLGLVVFSFVFWLSFPESIFHLNFMEMNWIVSYPTQNPGTCQLNCSQGLQGQLSRLFTWAEKRQGTGEQSCLIQRQQPQALVKRRRSTMVRNGGVILPAQLPLNLFEIPASALGNIQS